LTVPGCAGLCWTGSSAHIVPLLERPMTQSLSSGAVVRRRCLMCALLVSAPLAAQTRVPDSTTTRAALDLLRVQRNRVTGAVLNAVPAFTLEQALQGKVAGLRIDMNDGAPWSDGQMQIRGPSTLYGDPSPLVIVDGVQVTNTFAATLNTVDRDVFFAVPSTARVADFTPFEIGAVEVLKGPVATARYGARGANGVLLITTRRSASAASTATTSLLCKCRSRSWCLSVRFHRDCVCRIAERWTVAVQ
jgi:TonB-dependent SusC/RagA subfamily outer membrane receptor